MSIKTRIVDGGGSDTEAKVDSDNALRVTNTNVPPEDVSTNIRIFRQFLTDDGTASGSSDMRVNGSTSSRDFYIDAPIDADRYIDTLSISISDAGATLSQFGNIGALTNGVEIFYQDATLGNVIIGDNLTTNFRFLRLCAGGVHGIGSGATSYRANNVQGNSEGYLMFLDFEEVFGLPWGIRLKKDSKLRLVARVKDNLTGVDKFDIIAYGYDRLIND